MGPNLILNSFPKSGTHLVATVLKHFGLRQSLHFDSAIIHSSALQHRLMRQVLLCGTKDCSIGVDSPQDVNSAALGILLRLSNSRGFTTSHLNYNARVAKIIQSQSTKVILVIRDPRSLIYSFVQYVRTNPLHPLHCSSKNLTDQQLALCYLNGWESGRGRLLSLATRISNFSEWFRVDNLLIVKFEDVVGERGGGSAGAQVGTLMSVEQFVNEADDEQRRSDIAKSLYGTRTHTLRKGKVDSWRVELPTVLSNDDISRVSSLARSWGYDE